MVVPYTLSRNGLSRSRHANRADSPLTEHGKIVSAFVARNLQGANFTPDRIFCSPELRGVETPIFQMAAFFNAISENEEKRNIPVLVEPALAEWRNFDEEQTEKHWLTHQEFFLTIKLPLQSTAIPETTLMATNAPAKEAASPLWTAAAATPPAQEPTEPAFQLQIEPSDFITFKSDNLTSAPVDLVVEIKNTTAVRQVYKVKGTSNEIFRVRPSVAYLKPGEARKVKFSLVSKEVPDAKEHFFAVCHISAPDANDQKTAKQQWTEDTQPEGVKRLPVRLLKSDGSPWSAPTTPESVYL